MPSQRPARTITCAECSAVVPTTSYTQRYCPPCSDVRDRTRKRLWAREHPADPGIAVRSRERVRSRTKAAGVERNEGSGRSVLWMGDEDPDLLWLVRVAVPFQYAWSKNHIYTMRSQGHVALRAESRAARDALALSIRSALHDRTPVQAKVWVDILVQKPNHKGDAINVVDLVCDALKLAIDVDDRWFSIRRLDWEIVKTDPQLIVGIGQDTDVPVQACSSCGFIQPFDAFGKNRGAKNGIDRNCRDCLKGGGWGRPRR